MMGIRPYIRRHEDQAITILRITALVSCLIGLLLTGGAWWAYQEGVEDAIGARYAETPEEQAQFSNIAGRNYGAATALAAFAAASFTLAGYLQNLTPPVFQKNAEPEPEDESEDEDNVVRYAS